MAKYSTGGSPGGDGGGTCELCGTSTDDLRTVTVAGAKLQVCPDCASHGDGGGPKRDAGGDDGTNERRESPGKRAARNTARTLDAASGDSEHWEEEGTNYDRDQLPYLVRDYGERVVRARQDAGLKREELATELEIPETDLLAVEQGRATQAGVGGSVIAALEERLDVELADE
ncbi:helix-turn-helix domain-containing protein [Halanaeroarchaeum sulfurireducens]|uniref:Transcriptional regulator n=1 Tax=Halanaeroarchaeum sulfurireducens TaxID=1604004 RepID=A0A0F7PB14_9EURY|nr:multiprotein-bridging factor 1 family protein [Halanaeroarchaeum sulfurireducens]AKH97907.1 transcriptional regulator [Halanaeroarchaeum sulfurireducens]ALG82301.1 transcriptional regulator [Halanaeroarchaeum sulfurireducens]